MSGVVRRLAKQDYTVELLADGRRDEIGDMNDAIQIFRDNGLGATGSTPSGARTSR
ncbi:hypothetical protein ACOJBM_05365 [Rhizobium beringeri]